MILKASAANGAEASVLRSITLPVRGSAPCTGGRSSGDGR